MSDIQVSGDLRLLLEKFEEIKPKINDLETLIENIKGFVDKAVQTNELGWLNEKKDDWNTKGTVIFNNGKDKMASLNEQIGITIPALKKMTGVE